MLRRRTFVVISALASLTLTNVALAQRHARHVRRADRAHAHRASAPASHSCTRACGDDYQLEIISSLFPYDDGVTRGPGVLTLVVENRGSAPAPAFTVDVAQRTRFASLSRSPVAMLAPGERAVVQIPLEMGPDGAPCVAVTLDTWNVPGPPPQVYATTTPTDVLPVPIATLAAVSAITPSFVGR